MQQQTDGRTGSELYENRLFPFYRNLGELN